MVLALSLELVSHFTLIGSLVTMSVRERGKMFSGITEQHWFVHCLSYSRPPGTYMSSEQEALLSHSLIPALSALSLLCNGRSLVGTCL